MSLLQVSHQFPLNNNPSNPYCFGVEGVVSAYHQALQAVDLSGPTNMAPLINHVADFAEAAAAKTDRQVREGAVSRNFESPQVS